MRVDFKTDGGSVYFPALNPPVTIDTDELGAEEATTLERMIEDAGFFDVPATSTPPRGAADYFQYTISVTTPERSHTVRLTDPIGNPSLQALVDYLEGKARELRKAP